MTTLTINAHYGKTQCEFFSKAPWENSKLNLKDPKLNTIPVIMLTGIGEPLKISLSAEAMGDYLGEEPNAYVEKPVKRETLQEAVRKVFGD